MKKEIYRTIINHLVSVWGIWVSKFTSLMVSISEAALSSARNPNRESLTNLYGLPTLWHPLRMRLVAPESEYTYGIQK